MSTEPYTYAETKGAPGAPLFFTFHGTGGNEQQFHDLAQQLLPGAHVISPRGDVNEHGAARYFRRTAEGVYDMPDLAARTSKMAAFVAAHRARVSPPVTVALGYSNGANILASLLIDTPDLFDAAVLMHPLIPWAPKESPGLAERRLLITAGQRDPICPPALTSAFGDYLKSQGAKAEINWHEGGHEIRPGELTAAKGFLGQYQSQAVS